MYMHMHCMCCSPVRCNIIQQRGKSINKPSAALAYSSDRVSTFNPVG